MDWDFSGKGDMMNLLHKIESRLDILSGKPVIKGTRISVELVIRKLGEGMSVGDLLDAYPTLTREDVQAALTYAAGAVAHEELLSVSSE
jgi:uncharacterized protein (DUF433 family)